MRIQCHGQDLKANLMAQYAGKVRDNAQLFAQSVEIFGVSSTPFLGPLIPTPRLHHHLYLLLSINLHPNIQSSSTDPKPSPTPISTLYPFPPPLTHHLFFSSTNFPLSSFSCSSLLLLFFHQSLSTPILFTINPLLFLTLPSIATLDPFLFLVLHHLYTPFLHCALSSSSSSYSHPFQSLHGLSFSFLPSSDYTVSYPSLLYSHPPHPAPSLSLLVLPLCSTPQHGITHAGTAITKYWRGLLQHSNGESRRGMRVEVETSPPITARVEAPVLSGVLVEEGVPLDRWGKQHGNGLGKYVAARMRG